jgi:hypothetical protein
METTDTFLQELKALLLKHNASISWRCGDASDTHGIYDEQMVIEWHGVGKHDLSGSLIPMNRELSLNGGYVDSFELNNYGV